MKKYLVLLLISTFAFGQVNTTTTTAGKYKMNIPALGTKNDSLVIWNGTDKFLKILPVSEIKGTTNLDKLATPTGITIFSSTGNDVVLPLVTSQNSGLQSPADKTKLDGIEVGAQVNVPTNLSPAFSADGGVIYSSTGTNAFIPLVTTTIAGLASPLDKIKLNGIATGATANSTDAQLRDRATHTGAQAIATVTGLQTALDAKVDKVTGKSLLSDAEIARLATLANYTHPTNHPPSIITQDASNRFVTDAEKSAWNAKQTAIGYTTENIANKNIANGYAGLGSDGKLIASQLPSITISDTYVVASQATMLGLSGAEKGDVAIRTDLNRSFILKGNSYSTLADWQELLTPTSAVTTVFGRNGAVTAQTGDYTATMVGAPSGSGTSTGTNTGDQTTITGNAGTATVLQTARTINGVAFNGSTNITVSDATKEPSFSKNTAFNKNFGNTVGTVAEGNDSRILNGQTAFGWGNHSGLYPSLTGTGANGTWGINISGNSSSATTATNSIKWKGRELSSNILDTGYGAEVEGIYVNLVNNPSNTYPMSKNGIKEALGLGSNAYTSTAYLPLTGGVLTGTLNGTMFNITTSDARFTGGNSVGRLLFGNSSTTSYAEFNGSASGAPDDIALVSSVGRIRLFTNGIERVIIANNGASTFASSVTAKGGMNLVSNNVNEDNVSYTITNTAASKIYSFTTGKQGITHNGVGIWNRTDNTHPIWFEDNGAATLSSSVTASGFFNSSDRRLKTILKRDGDVAYFKWKDGRDDKTHIGYIAQEVRKTNPDQVQKGEDKMLSVNYVEILVEKVRMLEKRIEELEKK